MLEFALASTMLFMLTIGMVDFTRAFFEASATTHSAGSAVFYGAQRLVYSSWYTEMETVAGEDADELNRTGEFTTAADRYCDCPAAPATGPADANAVDCATSGSDTCVGYGLPRVYVRMTVTKPYDLMGPWIGIPDSFDIKQTAYFRVQ